MAVLTDAGYAVESARSSSQAIQLAGENTFDLLLTEDIMVGGTARDVLAFVGENLPGVPVVVMSSSFVSGGLGLLAGARALVSKPFNAEGLLGAVQVALQGNSRVLEMEAPA